MRLPADENVEQPVVNRLREAGHDVICVADVLPGASDEDVLSMADRDNRVLLTNDKDFGDTAFRQGRAAAGVILLRFRTEDGSARALHLAHSLPLLVGRVDGHFAVVNEDSIRLRPLRR
ncbi:MAG: DUF5615 family PIN-like protein [Armatimonadota bacterium]